MAVLRIIDSGFATSDRSGGNANSGTDINSLGDYIANGGNPITLTSEEIDIKGGTQVSAEPNPSSNTATNTHYNTFENEQYTIPFKIDVTSATDRALLKEIRVLSKTGGVKILYSSDTSTTIKMLPEILGRTDTQFNTSTINGVNLAGIPVFICRVIGYSINQKAGISRNYQVTGSLTIKEDKVF